MARNEPCECALYTVAILSIYYFQLKLLAQLHFGRLFIVDRKASGS